MWEWRFACAGRWSRRSLRSPTSPLRKRCTQHLGTAIRLLNEGAAEPGSGRRRDEKGYRSIPQEYLPTLAKGTRNKFGSMLKVHIEPKSGSVGIADVSPMAVDAWLKSLTISPLRRGELRRLLKQLIDKAMFWEMIRRDVNPMTLVKVKGVSKQGEEGRTAEP